LKRVENMACRRIFLTTFEMFGELAETVLNVWYIFNQKSRRMQNLYCLRSDILTQWRSLFTVLKFAIWMGVVSRNFRSKEEIASVNDQDMHWLVLSFCFSMFITLCLAASTHLARAHLQLVWLLMSQETQRQGSWCYRRKFLCQDKRMKLVHVPYLYFSFEMLSLGIDQVLIIRLIKKYSWVFWPAHLKNCCKSSLACCT